MSQRRDLLRFIATLGAAGVSGYLQDVLAAGDLPPGLHRLEGSATINGKPAKSGAAVSLGDRISTGPNSQAVVVQKGDAFLMRADTVIEIKGRDGVLTDLLISTGRVLSVFAKKPVTVKAAVATIGIRGTGAYLEVEKDSVYFCLCYGEAVIDGKNMPSKVVKTDHHESPLWLYEDGAALKAEPGPFLNHTDDELILLEGLVGREAPFVKSGVYPTKRY